MSNKVIISCAVIGSAHTPTMSDALPVTPEEIADEARCSGIAQSESANYLTLQRESRVDEGTANGLGVLFGYTAGTQRLVPRRPNSCFHVVDNVFRFVLIE